MKCMVIDGNSIINRAYYGIRPLTNREGLYTHAVFGFLTTLLRLKEEERPDALCVTFDLHAPTFRHKADEAYKATRKPMPEELRMQVPVLKEVLDTLNIPRYEMEGWEADDLIGTISRKCEAAGWDCVVVTGDKDSLQLITDHTKVKLVSTRMGQTTTKDMTPETFREQYGFDPIMGTMLDCQWLHTEVGDYWYEGGIRQGTEGRGKEIYDLDSDAWYWLDAVDNGKKAVSKDVYQESDGGKWVRYDADGHMIKGWDTQGVDRFYFDPITGAMAKGVVMIDGIRYWFDSRTGALIAPK